jgi:hypothetical protein
MFDFGINSMKPLIRFFTLGMVAAVLSLQGGCMHFSAKSGVVWQWHQAGTELYHAHFSPDAREVALVRKRHIPDGAEAEGIPKEKLKEEFNRIDQDERYADPEVIIAEVGKDQITRIDWGWSPAFSPDSSQIAYSHQLKSISRFRILAKTLEGNDIRIYDRSRKSTEVVASPEEGYLSDPIFSLDGRYVVYSIGDAVNGAYGGNIGLARVRLDTSEKELLYPIPLNRSLYQIVAPKGYVSGRLLSVVKNRYGDEYECDLIEFEPNPTVVYSWGRLNRFDKKQPAFAQGPGGELLIFDGTWHSVAESVNAKLSSIEEQVPGIPSPSGVFVARGSKSGLIVQDLRSGAKIREWNLAGPVREISWSSDSRRILVIVSKYRDGGEGIFFKFDELLVLEP